MDESNPLVMAERAVLGAALASQEGADAAVRIIGPEPTPFTEPAHRLIYAAALRVRERGDPVDTASTSAELSQRDQCEEAGGPDYLQQLAEAVDHATLERDARTVAFTEPSLTSEHAAWMRDVLPGYLDVLEDPRKAPRPSVSTGFADLDALLNGLEPGTLTVISGRPSVGKSTLLSDFVRSCALRQAIPTLWVDQENPRQRALDRIVSAEAKIPLHAIRAQLMTDENWTRAAQFMSRLFYAPLVLHAGSRVDVGQVRQMALESGAGLVAVDGLQLLKTSPDRDTREREVSDITRSLKDLALELGVAVVATAHLNRVPLQRPDPRPTLDDLRESDLIAHQADTVVLIDLPGLRDKDFLRVGEADLLVVKHRNGPTTDITVAFQGHYSRFRDLPPGWC